MTSGRLNLFQTAFLCVFLFVFLRAGRLDDNADAAGFGGGFHTGFGAAVDGVNLGFGVVGNDRTFGHIAAALYFGIAGQGNQTGCGRIRHGIGLTVDHAFAAVQLLAEFDGRAGSDHRIVSMEELASTPTPKIVVRAADMDREEFDRILSSLDVSRTHEVFVGWTSWADIEPLGVTKASGLESLRQRLGLPSCGTVAVGDGTNDIAMIEWAAFGVAMGGASDEVRAHADHVTAAVENDGAAAVMHALLRRCGVAVR